MITNYRFKDDKGHELFAVYFRKQSTNGNHDRRERIQDCFYCPICKRFLTCKIIKTEVKTEVKPFEDS